MKEFYEKASNGGLAKLRIEEKWAAILVAVSVTMRGISPPHKRLETVKYGHSLATLGQNFS